MKQRKDIENQIEMCEKKKLWLEYQDLREKVSNPYILTWYHVCQDITPEQYAKIHAYHLLGVRKHSFCFC